MKDKVIASLVQFAPTWLEAEENAERMKQQESVGCVPYSRYLLSTGYHWGQEPRGMMTASVRIEMGNPG